MGITRCSGLCNRQDFIEKYNIPFTKPYNGKIKKLTKLRMEKYVRGYTKCRGCDIVYPPQPEVDLPYVREMFINTSVMMCPCCHCRTAWSPASKSKSRARKLGYARKEYIRNSIVINQI